MVLDPGHGGNDPGAVFGKYFEKVYNLDIALRCEKILKSKGVNVVLTRTTDKSRAWMRELNLPMIETHIYL